MRLLQAVLVIFAFSSSYQHEIVKRESKGEKRVVCYYTNWSVYRPGTAKFNPQNINPYLCTHLIYAFGGLDRENGLRPYDKYQDIEQGGYAKFTGLKTYNKALKTMLAIGGWNEGSARFSPLVADEERRKEFVKNVVKFLRVNHFDGLDLDWEYPAFRDGGKPRDKDNYAQLVQELREEFERESSKTGRPRLLLTMAVPAGLEYIDKGYDVPKLNRYLDFFNILSYDYHSAFEPAINHHSPLYSLEEAGEYNFDSQLTIDATVKHYLLKGADANKLVLGIPTYGRSYTLFNPDSTDLGSPADGPGEQGDATREKGYLAYYEICENVKHGWTVEQPKESAMGPYAYKDNQWVGYDDEAIVKKKSQYVNEKDLGGIMFWSIDNDDFRGKCSSRPYPLIEAAKEALIGKAIHSNKLPSGPRGGKTSSKLSKHKPVRTTAAPTQAPHTVTTPEPPTTPDPGSDFVCKDEGFFPHPRDCKKYFWCLDSGPSNLGIVAHQFTCPSGLFFNKASDSCDFARNVICKKKPASTTTEAPKTTKEETKSGSKTTVKTTTTTTTTTTETPLEEEDEEYYVEKVEEDPQTIKQLISLIKKLGGVAELEKQLEGGSSETDSTTPAISKTLYSRVINRPNKYLPIQRNGPSGPQNEGLPRESGRSSSFKKDKPKYVTIQRERPNTSTTESDSEDYEDEVEEEKPKYKERHRGSQNEGLDSDKPTERSRPKYQPIERFRSKNQEKQNQEKQNEEETSDRSTTLRYTNIFRSRSTPSRDTSRDTSTATTSRYVTLQRQRNRQEEEGTTENELIEEEENTEELIETTTTPRPRVKVSDVLTTTPGVRTSTRVVTQVVEGASERQRVPLHKLQQILKDSENLIETVTKPYQSTTEEPKTKRPILNSFQKRRPDIVFTTTVRATPAYLSQRRNRIRSTTTTEVSEITQKSKGFIPSRSRFRPTTESQEVSSKEVSKEDIKPLNRFSTRQRFRNRNESPKESSKEDTKPLNRFSSRQSTTEASQTTERFSRTKSRYFNIRRTTTDKTTTEVKNEEEGLFSREYSRETNVIRRPLNSRKNENTTHVQNATSVTSKYEETTKPSLTTLQSTDRITVTTLPEKTSSIEITNVPDITISSTEENEITTIFEMVTNSTIAQVSVTENHLKLDQETSSNDVLVKMETTTVKPAAIPTRNRTKIILRKRKPEKQEDSLKSGSEEKSDILKRTDQFNQSRNSNEQRNTDRARVVVRRRKPEVTGKSIQFEDSPKKQNVTSTQTSRGRRKYNSDVNTIDQVPSRTRQTSTPKPQENSDNPKRRVIIRGRKKFDETTEKEVKQNGSDGKVRRVVYKKTIKDLAVGETGIPESQELDIENIENPQGKIKIWDSLQDVDYYIEDDDNQEITRQRRPIQRRPVSRSTTTTTTEAPTTPRPRTTVHSLKQRLNRFKTERNLKTTSPSTQVDATTIRTRKEFRRVIKPVQVDDSQLDSSQEEPVMKDTKTTQFHRETSFKPQHFSSRDDILYRTTQVEEQATEGSFTDEHVITDERGVIRFQENNESDEGIPDLANVAVAAIQSLATSPPTQATEQYTVTTARPTTKHITPQKRTRPTRPPTRIVTTTPVIIPTRNFARSSPRPFSKVTHSSRNLPHSSAPVYDYEDYYAEPVDVPLSGKVRIHNDGYIECLDIGNFPHPFSCRKFISCAKMENGHLLGWEYTCPKGLSFDPIGGICNWNAGLGCKE